MWCGDWLVPITTTHSVAENSLTFHLFHPKQRRKQPFRSDLFGRHSHCKTQCLKFSIMQLKGQNVVTPNRVGVMGSPVWECVIHCLGNLDGSVEKLREAAARYSLTGVGRFTRHMLAKFASRSFVKLEQLSTNPISFRICYILQRRTELMTAPLRLESGNCISYGSSSRDGNADEPIQQDKTQLGHAKFKVFDLSEAFSTCMWFYR